MSQVSGFSRKLIQLKLFFFQGWLFKKALWHKGDYFCLFTILYININ